MSKSNGIINETVHAVRASWDEIERERAHRRSSGSGQGEPMSTAIRSGCQCRDAVYEDGNEIEPADRWDCEHCPNCCGCTPCGYARVA